MKKGKTRRNLLLAGMICLLFALFIPGIHADAASKATKIKYETKYLSNAKEYLIVKGLNKKGKTVWTYKTKKYDQTQLDQVGCTVHGSRVYVFEGTNVRCLNKSTGKKLWVCKKVSPAGYEYTFDSSNNLYLIGGMDDYVYKISSKGKIVWKTDISSTDDYYPTKLKCKNKKLTITFAAGGDDFEGVYKHNVVLKMSNGKIQSYK
jgi:hypothetical protein